MVDRSKLPLDIEAAVQWLAIDLPNIANSLSESLSGLKHELKNLTREVEAMEAATEGFKVSVALVRKRLGLT